MEYREAINAGRMLVVSPFSQGVVRVSKETAEKRNGWILDHCDEAVFASLDPNGSLARLVAARPNLRYQVLCRKFILSVLQTMALGNPYTPGKSEGTDLSCVTRLSGDRPFKRRLGRGVLA